MIDQFKNIDKLMASVLGLSVELQVSDPWEFSVAVADDPKLAIVEQVSIRIHVKSGSTITHQNVLLRIAKPFAYKSLKYEHIIASPRHCGKGLPEFLNKEHVPFNFLRISADDALSDDPFASGDNWRGGPEAFTGNLAI